jgi:A/G-specific adenine glycosylase
MHADISKLNRTLRAHFKKHGRSHLPWRSTRDPYKILVSEVMLQQTQVERVTPYYTKFLKAFPDSRRLSRAPLSKVLMLWQGLGYNARGKRLRDAAIMIEKAFGGKFPDSIEKIESLPGVGPYTARAVASFAFNTAAIFIETNIRSVFIHHFFSTRSSKISDAELLPLVEMSLKTSRMQPRDFYAALMDYGSYLKKQGVRNNSKSKHYAKQSKFEGSRRQLRGQILKTILDAPTTLDGVVKKIGRSRSEIEAELEKMMKEELLIYKKFQFHIK